MAGYRTPIQAHWRPDVDGSITLATAIDRTFKELRG
jgi:hypothetical protein